MKLKSKLILFAFLISNISVFAQSSRQQRADNLFNKYAFVKASKIYTNLKERGFNVEYVDRKLADCYTMLRDPENAVKYYEQVVQQKNIPTEYFYRYAQALMGIEDYDNARIWVKKYHKAGGKRKLVDLFASDGILAGENFKPKQLYFVKKAPFNSDYSDFGAFELDGKIYFTSARDEGVSVKRLYGWNEQPFLDIYAIVKDNSKSVTYKNKLPGTVNSANHDGPVSITADGKTMYFSKNGDAIDETDNNSNKIKNLKIYRATLKDGIWTNLEPMPFNNDNYSVGHPSVTPDGRKLYFTSDEPGGYGGTDIYMVDIKDDGSIGSKNNLGNAINTAGNESFPFINTEEVLFFSSDGYPGLGLMDIYATVKDETGSVAHVINLGSPVNSSKDDFSFFMNSDGLTGYFASNRGKDVTNDDIFSFSRLPLIKVEGTVTDAANGKPIRKAQVTLFEKDNELISVKTDRMGYYKMEIDRETTYKITGVRKKYQNKSKTFDSFKIDSDQTTVKVDLSLDPVIDVKELAKLNQIYFDFNKYNIRRDAARELDKIVKLMTKEYPNIAIKIQSHTDSRGDDTFNLQLSQKRAQATYKYLISQGIDPKRIMGYDGLGEKQLINDCLNGVDCEENKHQLNRRSQFTIVTNELAKDSAQTVY